MQFVVYNTQSLQHESFATEGAAKRSCTAKNKKGTGQYAWTDFQNFDTNINTWTTTYNMMDPDRKPVPIRRADLGGCCDPATERYHCM